jgi:predicted GH43/DUF377 family glycosyl hydrolase
MNHSGIKLKIVKTGIQLLCKISFFSFFSFYFLTAPAQTQLNDVIGKPVLKYGSFGEWDVAVVWNPAVVKDGDTLRMWYTGHNESIWTASTTGKIGYAWSVDGFIWNKYEDNPVLQAEMEWEGGKLFGCAVIKDGDTLKMWYGAEWTRSPSNYKISPSRKIGYAESLDGRTWIKHPEPVLVPGPGQDWDSDYIVPHTVIKEENGYKMWFWAGKPGFPVQVESKPHIGLATSPDGLNWTKHNDPSTTIAPYTDSDPVLKLGPSSSWDAHRVINPIVLSTDSGYEMWYTGLKGPVTDETKQQIGYATSVDGIAWTKWPENPILDDSFTWGKGIYGGSVLKFDDTYHFWFACFHTPPTEARPQIGYANSRDIYIPDTVFLNALISAGVDTSEDGLISRDEAATFTHLELDNMGITTMKGLHAFVNLTKLTASNNKLTELNVRYNHLLEYLDCSNNQLAELDVSVCSTMHFLDCGGNSLHSLGLQNNINLEELRIYNNPDLHEVCVWTMPFPPVGVSIDTTGSPNVYFKDCAGPSLSALLISRDSVKVTSSETGVIYLVPKNTPRNIGMIRLVYIDTVAALANAPVNIGRSGLDIGEYWLYARDTIGNLSEHVVLIITDIIGLKNYKPVHLRLYPNPTNTFITVESVTSELTSIEITSINGQLIFSKKVEGTSHQLDLSSFHKGIYFITIRSKQFVATRKIVKL